MIERTKEPISFKVFETDRFSTVSVAVNMYAPTGTAFDYEENMLMFSFICELHKQRMMEKEKNLASKNFVYSSGFFFAALINVYGTRFLHPQFTQRKSEHLDLDLERVMDLDLQTKYMTKDIFDRVRAEKLSRGQRLRSNPISYSAAKLIDHVFADTHYGTELAGNPIKLQACPYPSSNQLIDFFEDMRNREREVYLLGQLELNPLDYSSSIESAPMKRSLKNKGSRLSERWINLRGQIIMTFAFQIGTIDTYSDYLIAQLIDGVIGKYGHSRLFEQFRYREIPAYHAVSRYDAMCELLIVSIAADERFEQEIERIVVETVTGVKMDSLELERAKSFLKNEIYYLLDTPEGTMSYSNILDGYKVSEGLIAPMLDSLTLTEFLKLASQIQYVGSHSLKEEAK